jgi:hypothetical protein
LHTLPTLFPFTYTESADEIGEQLANYDAKLSALRAELHRKMKWRARYGYGYRVLALERKSIAMFETWARNGRAKLRAIRPQAEAHEWRAAA